MKLHTRILLGLALGAAAGVAVNVAAGAAAFGLALVNGIGPGEGLARRPIDESPGSDYQPPAL